MEKMKFVVDGEEFDQGIFLPVRIIEGENEDDQKVRAAFVIDLNIPYPASHQFSLVLCAFLKLLADIIQTNTLNQAHYEKSTLCQKFNVLMQEMGKDIN